MSDENRTCAVCNEPTNGGRWCDDACRRMELQKVAHELGLEDLSRHDDETRYVIQALEDYVLVAMLCDDEFGGYIEALRRRQTRMAEAAARSVDGHAVWWTPDADEDADNQTIARYRLGHPLRATPA